MIKPILLTLLGLLIILAIARKCKSTKIFWILFISLCGGFIGGSIAAKLITNAALAKKDSCIKVEAKCTHALCVNCTELTKASDVILTHNGQSGLVSNIELLPVLLTSKLLIFMQPSIFISKSLQAFNPDTDIGTIYNTS